MTDIKPQESTGVPVPPSEPVAPVTPLKDKDGTGAPSDPDEHHATGGGAE
ncbi:hypothetical protein PJ985_06040 [Streptomyces sp. ACA25]|nr:hypothetical protein [Streptomyces sp. ACA25]MDB1087127.1 hypothetical protein [Streptomyces sp. ACA25]